ncbi:MAG: hypothetical protein ABIQ93_08520 [Saprospiraceae bacterium]
MDDDAGRGMVSTLFHKFKLTRMSNNKETRTGAQADTGIKSLTRQGKDTTLPEFPKQAPDNPDLNAVGNSAPVVQDLEEDLEPPVFYNPRLQVEDGRYWWIAGKENKPVSNFLVHPLYHLADPVNPKRVYRVKNDRGDKAVLCTPTKDLSSVSGFHAAVEAMGPFAPDFSSSAYAALKEWWFNTEKTAQEVGTLGHLPGTNLYAFANGIFDGKTFLPVNDFGIVEANQQQYFIPVFSSIYHGNEGLFQHERKFIHDPASSISFEQWASLFCRAFSENENGRIGVMFMCATVYRTAISNHTNFFPLLFLFGMKGTGKSTFRDSMLSLFGQPQDAVSLGSASSPKGFNRRLGQRRDALIVFEEYKNGIQPQLIEMLKSAYDLIGYERAQTTNDNRTHNTPVLSSVVVAGQELPTKENALFSRTITLEFLKTTFTDEQANAYNELTDIQNGSGITSATLELLQYRQNVETGFKWAYREMCAWLKDRKAPAGLSVEDQELDLRLPYNVDERSINNTAVLLAMYRVLEKHLIFPFSFGDLFDALVAKLKMQVEIMDKTNEVSIFWRSVEVLASQSKITLGRDYKIEKVENEELLYIYPPTVFAAYTEYMKRSGGTVVDDSTLGRYLKRHPGFRIGKDGRDTHQRRLTDEPGSKSSPKRCMAFELTSLQINFDS